MQKDLLNSVVKITRHRDVDSLELSLLSTISEFLQPTEAALYKDLSRFNGKGIESSASLLCDEQGKIHWRSREIIEEPTKELQCCLSLPAQSAYKTNPATKHAGSLSSLTTKYQALCILLLNTLIPVSKLR